MPERGKGLFGKYGNPVISIFGMPRFSTSANLVTQDLQVINCLVKPYVDSENKELLFLLKKTDKQILALKRELKLLKRTMAPDTSKALGYLEEVLSSMQLIEKQVATLKVQLPQKLSEPGIDNKSVATQVVPVPSLNIVKFKENMLFKAKESIDKNLHNLKNEIDKFTKDLKRHKSPAPNH
jgi:hypothetical protein